MSLVPPDGWGGSPKFRDKFPDGCPWSRPPECQPELGQLTDTVREERYRVQTFCSTPAAARNYDVGNTLHVSDYLQTQDQLCILDKVKTTHQCTLDILVIAASFMTFDGGGDNYTLHVYGAAVTATNLRTRLLTQHSTQSSLVI